MKLMSELRRRNVLRMAALYAVAAWLIVQVADVLIDLAKLPDWVGTTTLWLLAVGFPIALIFSWIYEITPEGISLEKDFDAAESITRVTGRRLNFVVFALLCSAVILFAVDKWWFNGTYKPGTPMSNSIAVLAFANMSNDPNQEFFSDGISEEILNLLAQIPELRVISRTSAFYFKDKDFQLKDIAGQLNVEYILEGSVRTTGNNIRITAQLIEANSDTHVWSQTYDRALKNIFDIQDEIARQVVSNLKVNLLNSTPKVPRINQEAHTLVLEAEYFRALQTKEDISKAEVLYEKALKVDPNYARAWVGLSFVYLDQVNADTRPQVEGYKLAENAANEALKHDPDYGPAYERLATIALRRDSNLEAAAGNFERALLHSPNNNAIRANSAFFLRSLGHIDMAISMYESFIDLDPVHPVAHHGLGVLYLDDNNLDLARRSMLKALALSPEYISVHYFLGVMDLLEGNPESALQYFNDEPDEEYKIKGQTLAYFDLDDKEASDAALAELIAGYGDLWPSEVAQVYSYVEEFDKAFEWLNKSGDDPGGWYDTRYDPLLWNLHDDPRWSVFLQQMGVSDDILSKIDFDVSIVTKVNSQYIAN